ncbi:MAG TPA: SHOCT domain-containing protein [Chloroflexi bacterium]|nr:SHOCT domain-containing protein [Chloroflexota bacterium]
MMMEHIWGWGGMWFGWLLMLGFAVAVVVLMVWLIRLSAPTGRLNTGGSESDPQLQSALEILQARYARGEISKEEYLDVRATLLLP